MKIPQLSIIFQWDHHWAGPRLTSPFRQLCASRLRPSAAAAARIGLSLSSSTNRGFTNHNSMDWWENLHQKPWFLQFLPMKKSQGFPVEFPSNQSNDKWVGIL